MPEVQRADAMGAPDPKSVERAGTSAASKAAKAIPDQSHCHCRMNRRASKSETPGELNGFVSRTCFVPELYNAVHSPLGKSVPLVLRKLWLSEVTGPHTDHRAPKSSKKPAGVSLHRGNLSTQVPFGTA